VRRVVRTTLVLLGRIARRTRTPADDAMVAILQANEERLVDAVLGLLGQSPGLEPTEEQVVAALAAVGIQV
jgi:hypothetical protein